MSGITLVLIGKAGHGKSSTGNTILQKMSFKEDIKMSDGTELIELERCTLDDDTLLTVYDTPDLMSAIMSEEKITKQLDGLMGQDNKVDLYCFVFDFLSQFTQEEADSIDLLKARLGEHFLKKNGLVVVTHGDNCETRAKQEGVTSQTLFQDWCMSAGPAFSLLLSEVNGNVLLANNKGDFSEKGPRLESSRELRKMIQEVAKKNKHGDQEDQQEYPRLYGDNVNVNFCTIS